MNIKFLSSIICASTDKAVPTWVSNSFPIIEIVLAVLITICSIFMIVAVVAQNG